MQTNSKIKVRAIKVFMVVTSIMFTSTVFTSYGQVLVSQAFPEVKYKTPPANLELAYTLPMTVLRVKVKLKHKISVAGPLKDEATKFFNADIGVRTNSNHYEIENINVKPYKEADPSFVFSVSGLSSSRLDLFELTSQGLMPKPIAGEEKIQNKFFGKSDNGKYKAPLNYGDVIIEHPFLKSSVAEISKEQLAQMASAQITLIRKKRMELITSDAGENVFNAGLKDAIETFNSLEKQYLALFLGETREESITYEFDYIPNKGQNSSVLFYISEDSGFSQNPVEGAVPITIDLSVDSRAHTMTPFKPSTEPDKYAQKRPFIVYRLPESVEYRLVKDKEILLSARALVYQFGLLVEIPLASVGK